MQPRDKKGRFLPKSKQKNTQKLTFSDIKQYIDARIECIVEEQYSSWIYRFFHELLIDYRNNSKLEWE